MIPSDTYETYAINACLKEEKRVAGNKGPSLSQSTETPGFKYIYTYIL